MLSMTIFKLQPLPAKNKIWKLCLVCLNQLLRSLLFLNWQVFLRKARWMKRRRWANSVSLRKSTKAKLSFRFFLFYLRFVLAKHFDIFSVFSTKPEACWGLKEIKIANLEFSGDNFACRGKRISSVGCWRRTVRKI